MKIIECQKAYIGSTNFVDDNNVVLGWDDDQSCCELFGYAILNELLESVDNIDILTEAKEINIEDYNFNTSFFKEVVGHFEDGGCVVFELISKRKPNLYLYLYNSHNGYYSHGFCLSVEDEMGKEKNIVEDSI